MWELLNQAFLCALIQQGGMDHLPHVTDEEIKAKRSRRNLNKNHTATTWWGWDGNPGFRMLQL